MTLKANRFKIQWHPAFYAALQIEFEDYEEILHFESEHLLGKKPMQMDLLIIKKTSDRIIEKNIGKIFRTYNIIEYKSPADYISINDFYKVLAYSCFFKSESGMINQIKIQEITVTFACEKYPVKLIKHLENERHLNVINIEEGIYYVLGDLFPIQILCTSKLSPDQNLWLRSLTDKMTEVSLVNKLLEEYKDKEKIDLYNSAMDVIVRANQALFEEDRTMCKALDEIMQPRIDKAVELAVDKAVELAVDEAVELAVDKAVVLATDELLKNVTAKLKNLGMSAEQIGEVIGSNYTLETQT